MDNQKPVVSVCITTYNHKNYISKCLDGVLMQKTSFPFEILLGEDESSDGTREICQIYAAQHPDKIRLFLRSRKDVIYINGRPTGRYNFTQNFKAAKGKYIAICEGDDYWTDETKLQKQFDALENNPDYAMAFHNADICKEDEIVGPKVPADRQKDATISDVINGLIMPTMTIFFRKEYIDNLPPVFLKVLNADTFLIHLLMLKGKAKFHQDIKPAVYTVHAGGIWSTKKELYRFKNSVITRSSLLQFLPRDLRRLQIRKIYALQRGIVERSFKNFDFSLLFFLVGNFIKVTIELIRCKLSVGKNKIESPLVNKGVE